MDDFSLVMSTATAVASMAVAIVALGYTWAQERRDVKRALSAMHADLTSGEVAHARDVVGDLRFGVVAKGRMTCAKKNRGREEIRAYFTLIWAVERVDNALSMYTTRRTLRLEHYVKWNLDELTRNIVWLRQAHGSRLGISDQDAWSSFTNRLTSRSVKESVERALEYQHTASAGST